MKNNKIVATIITAIILTAGVLYFVLNWPIPLLPTSNVVSVTCSPPQPKGIEGSAISYYQGVIGEKAVRLITWNNNETPQHYLSEGELVYEYESACPQYAEVDFSSGGNITLSFSGGGANTITLKGNLCGKEVENTDGTINWPAICHEMLLEGDLKSPPFILLRTEKFDIEDYLKGRFQSPI